CNAMNECALGLATFCATVGSGCSQDSNCCSGNCSTAGICVERECKPATAECTSAGECCTGSCSEVGTCAGLRCTGDGAPCEEHFDCCSGLCNPYTGSCEPPPPLVF